VHIRLGVESLIINECLKECRKRFKDEKLILICIENCLLSRKYRVVIDPETGKHILIRRKSKL